MSSCKKCQSPHTVKHGFVRQQQQRWLCKNCGYNFVDGDKRTQGKTHPALKALAILLCCCGVSFRLTARLFNVNHSLVQYWYKGFCEQLPPLEIFPPESVNVVEVDEMRTFLDSKKKSAGSTKPLPPLMAILDWSDWQWVVVTLPH